MGGNAHNRRRKKLFLDLLQKSDPSLGEFETRKKGLSPEEIEKETERLWARIQQEEKQISSFLSRFLRRIRFFIRRRQL